MSSYKVALRLPSTICPLAKVVTEGTAFAIGYGPIYIGYGLAVLIPSIAVAIRRLHDVGKSGWMYLIVILPIVGPIWLIILFVREGEQCENLYGPDPKLE